MKTDQKYPPRRNRQGRTGSMLIAFLSIILICASPFWWSGCDSQDPTIQPDPDPDPDPPEEPPVELICTTGPIADAFYPLEKGNFWKYVGRNSGGVVLDTVWHLISQEWMLDLGEGRDKLYGRYPTTFGQPVPPNAHLVFSNDQGFGQAGFISLADTLVALNLTKPYPAPVGTITYTHLYTLSGSEIRDSIRTELISIDTQIETPAGTFSTVVYRHYIPPVGNTVAGHLSDHYLTAGIGRVAYIIRSVNTAGALVSWLLNDYCLMQPE